MIFPSTTARTPRRSALSLSLALGLGMSVGTVASAQPLPAATDLSRAIGVTLLETATTPADAKASKYVRASLRGPQPTSVNHVVDTCADDDSPGSLRAIIASPNTGDDDTIDLTQLPMGCSTITLDSSTHTPEGIKISQPNLHILGTSGVTIDAGYQSSIFRHSGNGTLDIEDLTISGGKYVSANQPFGGCIYSNGSVTLKNARVEGCVVTGTGANPAAGGAIYARQDVNLDWSAITHGSANGDGAGSNAYGGGLFVGGNLQSTYSTISHNTVSADNFGVGGGAFVKSAVLSISSSTISSNNADVDAGLSFYNNLGGGTIVDSTISGNEAILSIGALYTNGTLQIANSTIAFNRDSMGYAGVYAAGSSLTLESSIIADNSGHPGPADVWVSQATMVSGSHNLIVAAPGVSGLTNTITDCPRLDPLADNGGATLTHAINPMSPGIDAGSAPPGLLFDQTGYARVEGVAADIGAFEWRSGTGTDRIFVGGFDGLCDQ